MSLAQTPPPVKYCKSAATNFLPFYSLPEIPTNRPQNPLKPVVNYAKSGLFHRPDSLLLIDHVDDLDVDECKKLEKNKSLVDKVEDYYNNYGMKKEAIRLNECAQHIEYAVDADGNKMVNRVWFCKHRFCPICMPKKSAKLVANFEKNFPTIITKSKVNKPRLIFLTLTERNFPVNRVKMWLDDVNRAFRKLSQTKDFSASFLGSVRKYEFTQDKKGLCHAHVHMILLVDAQFYYPGSQLYYTHDDFVRMWKKYRNLNYNPQVHVQYAKDNKEKGSDMAAAIECLKYTIKPQDLEKLTNFDNDFLCVLTKQTENRRLVNCTGMLKSVLVDIDEDEIENDEKIEPVKKVYATWNRYIKHYQMRTKKYSAYMKKYGRVVSWVSNEIYIEDLQI